MRRKNKIVILVDWYIPGFKAGGPIRSVANIVGHLKEVYDFRIITSDRDLHSVTPYEGIISDTWMEKEEGYSIYYLSKDNINYKNIKRLMLAEQADAIYLNSLFSVFFTLMPLLIRKKFLPGRRVVLAPRGMLGEGALNQKSIKKKSFLLFAKFLGLYKNIRWHVSSAFEANEVRRIFGKNSSIHIALNLSAPSSIRYVPRRKTSGEMKAVYISRVASVKNLEGALRVLSKLPADCHVEYDIYGPLEDAEYWGKCLQLISEMPAHIKVNYCGALPNEEVAAKLANYHFGLMLTFNENFGHSIVETMIAGCPVIISDRTPWRGLSEKNVGWDLSLEQESKIIETVDHACRMDQMEFDHWSMAAYEYARFIIKNPEAVEQNRLLFV